MGALSVAADLLDPRPAPFQHDPAGWIAATLHETLWSKQIEIAESVRDHKKTAVKASHAVGKSFTASRLLSWWLSQHPKGEAFGVTTAPTYPQVRAILWREIRRAHRKGRLDGRVNQTEWWFGDELVAYGRKPADYDEEAFQGIHARYVLAVLDEACHDDQTEVMTDDGWKLFSELDGSELLLTMDPDTHVSRYSKPEKIIAKPYRGKMYLYEAKGANYCVTPDHDMFYHGRSHNADTHWRKAPMTELANGDNKYMKKVIDWQADDQEWYVIPEFQSARKHFPEKRVRMDDWMEFLGWYCSEGSLHKDRGVHGGIAIAQKGQEPLQEIAGLIDRMGFNPRVYEGYVRVHSRQLGHHMSALGPNCLEKRIPRYAKMCSARQIAIFLESFMRGDGYKKANGYVLYTSSPGMADDLQEMVLKTGMPSVVSKRPLAGMQSDFGTHIATSSVDGYVVTMPTRRSKIKHYPHNLKEIDYDGMVYCARVPPDGLLLTRRKGYSLWSGNCGVPADLWTAVDSITTGDDCRILAIGNPDNPDSHFAKICQPGSGWNVITVDGLQTPNVNRDTLAAALRVEGLDPDAYADLLDECPETRERVPDVLRHNLVSVSWIADKVKHWGPQSPLFRAKVRGEFADSSEDTVIPLSLVKASQQRWLDGVTEGEPTRAGVDVARGGGDMTAIAVRHGRRIDRVVEVNVADTMPIVGLVQQHGKGVEAVVDVIGVGAGVFDRLRELGQKAVPFNAAAAAQGKDRSGALGFVNARSQAWWGLRELLEDGEIDLPDDDELAAELTAPRWSVTSSGKIKVESKDEIRKRLGRSTDKGDAVIQSVWTDGRPGARTVQVPRGSRSQVGSRLPQTQRTIRR